MATQKEKIKARLKKDYYSDLMVLAATQTRIQDNYMDVIINLSDKFSTIHSTNYQAVRFDRPSLCLYDMKSGMF